MHSHAEHEERGPELFHTVLREREGLPFRPRRRQSQTHRNPDHPRENIEPRTRTLP